MKINSPAEDRIIVDLTKEDLQELDITYDDMDYSTIETRRVIWTLLDEAGKKLGRELDPSRRMIIEAMPKIEGGCVLSFTILDGRRKAANQKQFLRKQCESLICEFDNLDSLFAATENFETAAENTQSGLYENGGKYRLIISAKSNITDIKRHFSEFGSTECCDKLACEFTKEHWRAIAEKNAINKILCR